MTSEGENTVDDDLEELESLPLKSVSVDRLEVAFAKALT
jgi:hypothetical protein